MLVGNPIETALCTKIMMGVDFVPADISDGEGQ